MQYLTLRQIQEAELEILVFFDRLCKKEDLRYSLLGGTLLGAVRHKGFIPWDDDIDVAMPRPDYERFRQVAPQLLASTHYRLIGFPTADAEDPAFTKLIDENIVVKDHFRDELFNLWIDVMPVDGLPESDAETQRIYDKAKRLRQFALTAHADLSAGRTPLRKVLKNIFHPFDRAFSIGKRCEVALNKLARTYSYEDAEYVGPISWGLYGANEKMPKNAYKEFIDVEFEGNLFPALSCPDHYLSSLYGDYMQLPPESERSGHTMRAWYASGASMPDGAAS